MSMKKLFITLSCLLLLAGCQQQNDKNQNILQETSEAQTVLEQELTDNEVVSLTYDVLNALHYYYYASINNGSDDEDFITMMVTLMQKNKKFESGIAIMSDYLESEREIVQLTARGMILGAQMNIEANNRLLNFIKSLDQSNLGTMEMSAIIAESISMRKDGFGLIMTSAPQIAYLIFEPASSNNPSGKIPYSITKEHREKILNEIDRLFAESFVKEKISIEITKEYNAILLAVDNIRENLIFDTYEESFAGSSL